MAEKTYRIGEAADILQLKTYVLRFWESEFSQLAPLRTDKGQRLYTESHLALLRRIQHLCHEQGMTIGGAKRIMAAEQRHGGGKGMEAVPVPGVLAGPTSFTNSSVAVPQPDCAPASLPTQGPAEDTLRVLRDELLELRNLLLSQ